MSDTASRAAEAMWANDYASKWLGMQIRAVAEGTATLTLQVQQHHCNGHGMCHGGITFALADSAFAFACNSRNQATVAQTCTITFISPVERGDKLTATAREVSLRGRSGIYDISVTRQSGEVIAEFRGHSRAIQGTLYEDDT